MKRLMAIFLKGSLSVLVALMFFVTVPGCQQEEGTMENAGKKADESIEEAQDTMNKADQKIDEVIDKSKDAMEDAAQKTTE